MSVSFVFRGTLERLEQWLGSWTHKLIAYGVMTGFGFVIYLLRRNPTNREFKPPPMSYLFLPPLLLLGLMFFIGLSELSDSGMIVITSTPLAGPRQGPRLPRGGREHSSRARQS